MNKKYKLNIEHTLTYTLPKLILTPALEIKSINHLPTEVFIYCRTSLPNEGGLKYPAVNAACFSRQNRHLLEGGSAPGTPWGE